MTSQAFRCMFKLSFAVAYASNGADLTSRLLKTCFALLLHLRATPRVASASLAIPQRIGAFDSDS
jgi:hypothetical protein